YIRARFGGMELTDNVHWRDLYQRNGTVMSTSMGRKRAGRWRVEQDQLCIELEGEPIPKCYDVWISGKEVELRSEGLLPLRGPLEPASGRNWCPEPEVRTHRAANAVANFGFKRCTRIIELLVVLRFRKFVSERAASAYELRNLRTTSPKPSGVFACCMNNISGKHPQHIPFGRKNCRRVEISGHCKGDWDDHCGDTCPRPNPRGRCLFFASRPARVRRTGGACRSNGARACRRAKMADQGADARSDRSLPVLAGTACHPSRRLCLVPAYRI